MSRRVFKRCIMCLRYHRQRSILPAMSGWQACYLSMQGARSYQLTAGAWFVQDKDSQRDPQGSVVGRLLQHSNPGVRDRGAALVREFTIKQAREQPQLDVALDHLPLRKSSDAASIITRGRWYADSPVRRTVCSAVVQLRALETPTSSSTASEHCSPRVRPATPAPVPLQHTDAADLCHAGAARRRLHAAAGSLRARSVPQRSTDGEWRSNQRRQRQERGGAAGAARARGAGVAPVTEHATPGRHRERCLGEPDEGAHGRRRLARCPNITCSGRRPHAGPGRCHAGSPTLAVDHRAPFCGVSLAWPRSRLVLRSCIRFAVTLTTPTGFQRLACYCTVRWHRDA